MQKRMATEFGHGSRHQSDSFGGIFLRMTDVFPICIWVNRWKTAKGPRHRLPEICCCSLPSQSIISRKDWQLEWGLSLAAAGISQDNTLLSAVGLAIGIGIQNIPEGSALSMPIRADGNSRLKAFNYGQLSAIVEPIAAVIGAAAVISMSAILPYALAFAAGAMIFVVVEELIPESQTNGNSDIATMWTYGRIYGHDDS